MVTRDVTKFNLNRVAYCVWCTDEGRMIDDGTIFKLSERQVHADLRQSLYRVAGEKRVRLR